MLGSSEPFTLRGSKTMGMQLHSFNEFSESSSFPGNLGGISLTPLPKLNERMTSSFVLLTWHPIYIGVCYGIITMFGRGC